MAPFIWNNIVFIQSWIPVVGKKHANVHLSSNLQMSVDMQDTECCFLEEKLLLEFLEVQMFFDVVLSTPEPVHTRWMLQNSRKQEKYIYV